MTFGEKLRSLRLENNMTQEDLSKMLNVSRATVGRYETNERFPDKNILKQIADIFDVTIDYLLGRTNNQHIHTSKTLKSDDNACTEIKEKIIKRLFEENLISEGEDISKELFENIIEYGIEAAIKIEKLSIRKKR